MDPLILLLLQIVPSFVAYGLVAERLAKRLATLPRARAVEPLLWTHAFRYAPLALLAPGQTSASVAVTATIAWGDFASGMLALVAIALVRLYGERATWSVWCFSIVSTADIVIALCAGLGSGIYEQPIGVGWFILTFYVPMVCVTQALLWLELIRQRAG